MLQSELSILALYALVVAVTLTIQLLLAMGDVGLPWLASPRDEPREFRRLHARARRATDNSFVAMGFFAPAVLAVQAMDLGGSTSILAAQLFLLARVVYVPLYLAGIPWLRTGTWVVGFLASLYLYLLLLV